MELRRRETPSFDSSASAARDHRSDLAAGAAASRPASFEPLVRTPAPSRSLCARVRGPWTLSEAGTALAVVPPPCRPATALAHFVLSLPASRTRPRWITPAAYSIPGQDRVESSPERPSSACSGEAPPRSKVAGVLRRRPARPASPGRPIPHGRPRLDRATYRSKPPDLDPTVLI